MGCRSEGRGCMWDAVEKKQISVGSSEGSHGSVKIL
jgi:hypothetical protein